MRDEITREEAAADLNTLRPQFHAAITNTSPEKFLIGAWALHALQSDGAEFAQGRFINCPPEAITTDIASQFAVRPWEIETLINELLCHQRESLYHFFHPRNWNHWSQLVSLLRDVENTESVIFNEAENIIDHLFQIASKQFEWQEGIINKSEIFRGLYIYGQGLCATYFEETHGISVNDFFACGFALMAMFRTHPSCERNLDFSLIGVSEESGNIALKLLSRPIGEARTMACHQRSIDQEIAYKPSVLRLVPCLQGGFRDRYLYCPLPELIIKRVTTGLFYDVVSGGHAIREDYGRRFERYVSKLIRSYQPLFEVYEESRYKTQAGQMRTPDLFLISPDDATQVIIECKASRMPYAARYSLYEENGKQYADMVKAVVQIWRHAYHSRIGLCMPSRNDRCAGLVLTLDSWFQAAVKRQQGVIEKARSDFIGQFPDASIEDQIPIAFAHMTEFEWVLRGGDVRSITDAIWEASQEHRRGWSLLNIHQESTQGLDRADFFFDDELGELLPIWRRILDMKEARRS